MSRNVAEALGAARERLAALGAGASDAAELMSRLIGCGRADLLREGAHALGAEEDRTFESWLTRRERGEPVQYITGRAAFRRLDLMVTRDVLIPRPETEWLVEAVLEVLGAEAIRWPHPRVLDLGTGSGAIALAITTEWPAARVTATDASEAALAVAHANAAALSATVEFVHGDWFGAVGGDDRFEIVISNPPYIATGEWDELPEDVRAFEPQIALFSGASGLDAIREIVDEAPRHLVASGLLALELAEARALEVAGWLEGAHDWAEVSLRDDLADRPRVLLARRAAGPAIAPAQWVEEREP